MGILTQIQEQDERNAATEILPDLISKLDSVEQHLSKLTKHTSDQTAYIKSADENTTAQLESLLISQPGEQHLTEFVEMRNRLSEIEKTIDAVVSWRMKGPRRVRILPEWRAWSARASTRSV